MASTRMALAATAWVALASPDSALAQAFTATEIQQTLDAHNSARCQVSPTAVSMPPVTWDAALAQVAQAYAMRARAFAHNPRRDAQFAGLGGKGPVGENLSLLSPSLATVATVVGSWVAERGSYTYQPLSRNDRKSGHYTQIVWAATRRIGCGKARRWGDRFFYVCNYAPAGNVIGRFPYGAGTGTNLSCLSGKR